MAELAVQFEVVKVFKPARGVFPWIRHFEEFFEV
jgi:hypothetical protein